MTKELRHGIVRACWNVTVLATLGACGPCTPPPLVDGGALTDGGVHDEDGGVSTDGGTPGDGGLDDGGGDDVEKLLALAKKLCVVETRSSENGASIAESLEGRCAPVDTITLDDGDEVPSASVLGCLPGQPIYERYRTLLLGGRAEIDVDVLDECLAALRGARAPLTIGTLETKQFTAEEIRDSAVCATILTPLLVENDECVQPWDCPAEFPCQAEPLFATTKRCLLPAEINQPCQTARNVYESDLRLCTSTAVCFDGICTTPRTEGMVCGPSFPACAQGLACSIFSTCEPPAAANELCALDEQCFPGLVCRGGQCLPPLETNDPCEPGASCADSCIVCRPSTIVDADAGVDDGGSPSWVCLARAALGGACDVDDHCRDALFCDDGVCSAMAGVAQNCTNDPCGPNLTCENGLCRVPGVVGQPCAAGNVPCIGSFCVVGVCESGQAFAPCQSDAHCTFGLICDVDGCREPPRVGAPCATDGRCDAEGFCDGERCRALPGPTEFCTPGGACNDTAFCAGGVCQSLRGPGEGCAFDEECASTLCLSTGVCGAETSSCKTTRIGFLDILILGMLPMVALGRRQRRNRYEPT